MSRSGVRRTVEVAEGRRLGGLRLVLTRGVPGPWGEAAKGLFQVKQIPFVRVAQQPGLSNDELFAWTGRRNAPVAVYENEPAVSRWTEILFLAERLAPSPSLLPSDPADRAQMFGLAHELCGEQGFGWSRRLMMLHPILRGAPDPPPEALQVPAELGRRYGYTARAGDAASARVRDILALFAGQLSRQRERGIRFLVGEGLSALDVFWAAFAAMVEPLPDDVCPMNPGLRAGYRLQASDEASPAMERLLEHRDFVYREYLELPVRFA